MRRPLALLSLLSALLVLAGCPGETKNACTPGAEKQALVGLLRDWYLYPDLLQAVDPTQYTTSQDLLDAMTKPARDLRMDRFWTYVTTVAASTTFFQEGTSVGFGVGLLVRGTDVFVSQVYPGSPAAAAGFARGDKLLQIGETEASLAAVTPDNVGDLIGPATAGLTRVFQVLPWGAAAPVLRGPATKGTFGLDPVPVVDAGQRWRIVDRPPKKLGYVALRTFITPADALLTQAVQAFKDAGVTDVVVDLRYNGGGLVDTAGLLANLLGGGDGGKTMVQLTNNPARSSAYNETSTFAPPAAAIAATRVAFITTGASASASELVPNVLEPYLAPPGGAAGIALVGAKTYGKPVGQRGFRLTGCDTVAYVVSFRLENAEGEGGYYDGLPDAPATGAPAFGGPLCAAEDDLGNAPGTDLEASTAAALTFLETGACPAPAAPAAKLGLTAAALPDAYPVAREPSLAQRHVNGLF